MANFNAVETFVGSLNTCLTKDDHPTDDTAKTVAYGPTYVFAQTNRILVNYIPSSYTCNNNDDNHCTISSNGIIGIVVSVAFVFLFLLLAS
jgi:hypothetical protein